MPRKYTILEQDRTPDASINNLLQWYGASLGLFSPRDKDSSCFRVFIVLFHALKDDEALRSDDIAERTGLSRGTVVHHLNKLQDRGIVATAENEYFIRVESLQRLTEDLRSDVNDALDDIMRVAHRIDAELGLD